MRCLARRAYGSRELYNKLIKKEYLPEDIEDSISYLEEIGLLDDTKFVNDYVNQLVRQGYGPLRISQKLTNLGISRDTVDAVLHHHDWPSLAKAYTAKKSHQFMQPCKIDNSKIDKNKLIRHLLYRGYRYSDIETIT